MVTDRYRAVPASRAAPFREWHGVCTPYRKGWTIKELTIRMLLRDGVAEDFHPAVVELVVAAVRGPYRCKDWMYAALARLVDSPELRQRVTAVTAGADRMAGQRAEFLLYVLSEPGLPVRRHTWARWRAAGSV
jgi:hypothetical protein